ncbi:MAG: glycosyltransferase [Armatimonadetes bacterium]|nr:glycosyltransferase [Armatimonadota bacterium]
MNRDMKIAFISANYPSPARPWYGTFVQQFVWAMARQGNECTVVRPTSLFELRHGRLRTKRVVEVAGNGTTVMVHPSLFVSLSSKDLKWAHTGRWTQRSLGIAAARTVKALPVRPDLIYGHFLYHAGKAAVDLGCAHDIPSVVGVGEGEFWTVKPFGLERARAELERASGFLAVSSHVRDQLVGQLQIAPGKILVEPNGVDLSRFFPEAQALARARLGLKPSLFLVVFVGAFAEKKGITEVVRATNGVSGLGLALIGKGPDALSSDRVVFKGQLPPESVAVWLSAADVFLLPSRIEGSCNSVIEAMACGLPIVTSNGRYMDDIVDEEVSIRVDPTDVSAIRDAILSLKNNPERRRQMSRAALRKARQLNINERARRVTAWMQGLVDDQMTALGRAWND